MRRGLAKSNNPPCYEANIRWTTSIGDEINGFRKEIALKNLGDSEAFSFRRANRCAGCVLSEPRSFDITQRRPTPEKLLKGCWDISEEWRHKNDWIVEAEVEKLCAGGCDHKQRFNPLHSSSQGLITLIVQFQWHSLVYQLWLPCEMIKHWRMYCHLLSLGIYMATVSKHCVLMQNKTSIIEIVRKQVESELSCCDRDRRYLSCRKSTLRFWRKREEKVRNSAHSLLSQAQKSKARRRGNNSRSVSCAILLNLNKFLRFLFLLLGGMPWGGGNQLSDKAVTFHVSEDSIASLLIDAGRPRGDIAAGHKRKWPNKVANFASYNGTESRLRVPFTCHASLAAIFHRAESRCV